MESLDSGCQKGVLRIFEQPLVELQIIGQSRPG